LFLPRRFCNFANLNCQAILVVQCSNCFSALLRRNRRVDSLGNALKAIGTLNDKNGLTVEIGKVTKGAAAETSFGIGADGKPLLAKDADGKGNYVANVVMTFKSADDMTAESFLTKEVIQKIGRNSLRQCLQHPLKIRILMTIRPRLYPKI